MKRHQGPVDLGLLLLFLLLLDLPYLEPRVIPIHDTFYNFISFHVFYSEFFVRGDLVQWYPYGAYGSPADFQQIISLTPMNYLVGVVGALLRITDAMLLFKLSVLAEQIVFVIGTWLLARRLFSSRATWLALAIAAAGTVVWYAQQWFELRFFYLLPLLLFFFVSFLQERRPELLWLAGLMAVAWSLGNAPYFIPVWALVLVIVAAAPALSLGRDWRRVLVPRVASGLWLGAFLAAVAAYAYLTLHSTDFMIMRDLSGRDPLTGAVDVEGFRSWGGNADLAIVARSFATGWPFQLPWGSGVDNSVYVGLLTLLGVGVAIVRERSRLFVGLVAAILALVLLSLGGSFATLVFYLPGMSQYRHVGLVYGLVKTLLIVASGYGLDRLFGWRAPALSYRLRWVVGGAVVAASALVVPMLLRGSEGTPWAADWSAQGLLRIWCYLALLALSLAATRSPKVGLLLAVAIDLSIYQAALFELRVPKLEPAYVRMLGAFDMDAIEYRAQRTRDPWLIAPDLRQRQVLELAKHPGAMEVYWVTYQMAQLDPCHSEFWNELVMLGVDELTQLEERQGLQLDDIKGCGRDKLRVVSDATIVREAHAARNVFLALPPGSVPAHDVIRIGTDTEVVSGRTQRRHAGEAEVIRFTPNELVARVKADPGGAWLIYADAMHPGWHATVDGRPVSIAEANLAFKAVRVPGGESVVRFWFERGLSYYASWAVAVFGLASGLAILTILFVEPFRPRRHPSDRA